MNFWMRCLIVVTKFGLRIVFPWMPKVFWDAIEALISHIYTSPMRHTEAKIFHDKAQECIGEACYYGKR